MTKPVSEVDKQLQDADRVTLVIANESNRGKRNACIFFGVIAVALVYFFGWNRWLFLFPALLGLGAALYQANILIVSSELKRRL
jgi:hypothetical protein